MANRQLLKIRDKIVERIDKSKMSPLEKRRWKKRLGLTVSDCSIIRFSQRMVNEKGAPYYQELRRPLKVKISSNIKQLEMTALDMRVREKVYEDILYTKNYTFQDIAVIRDPYKIAPLTALGGKEIRVFSYRLRRQLAILDAVEISGKFGGATGNFNAHLCAFPDFDWREFGAKFLSEKLGIVREEYTTQISNYDNLAALFDAFARINNIILDLDRDMWMYISMEYFKQKIKAGEVGSSAMPHKVNPIDFENSEGNIGIANAVFGHLASKLPVSRLQRDLTDSTVLRNIGVPLAHTLIAVASTMKGLGKLLLNRAAIDADLDNTWSVVAEAIQTVLRREGYPKPYETLKALTRKNEAVTAESIAEFIDTLNVSAEVKAELKTISPHSYTGY